RYVRWAGLLLGSELLERPALWARRLRRSLGTPLPRRLCRSGWAVATTGARERLDEPRAELRRQLLPIPRTLSRRPRRLGRARALAHARPAGLLGWRHGGSRRPLVWRGRR